MVVKKYFSVVKKNSYALIEMIVNVSIQIHLVVFSCNFSKQLMPQQLYVKCNEWLWIAAAVLAIQRLVNHNYQPHKWPHRRPRYNVPAIAALLVRIFRRHRILRWKNEKSNDKNAVNGMNIIKSISWNTIGLMNHKYIYTHTQNENKNDTDSKHKPNFTFVLQNGQFLSKFLSHRISFSLLSKPS